MDPIMKFLEEDEDETMHSGADVDAFTAQLNRDIEGNSQQQQQQKNPSDSETAALSQGNDGTTNQFLTQWQTSSHDGIAHFQSGQDCTGAEEKEHHSSQLEQHNHGSESENLKKENDPTTEQNDVQDGQNPFPGFQAMEIQPSGEQPTHIKETKQEREPQLQKLQNMSNHQSVAMTSNNQQLVSMESKSQESLSRMNQHAAGMGMSSQQAGSSGMSSQQAGSSGKSSSTQQQSASLKLNKQVPFGMLLPIIQPQLDKERAMQLHALYFKLKKNEISKDGFVRHMRSIVGDQMLKMAVYKLQTQAAKNSQNAPAQMQPQSQAPGRPSSDLSNPKTDDTAKREVDRQADSSASSQERTHPAFPTQGHNKQQHMHFSQASFPTYGNAGSSYSPFSAPNLSSTTSVRPQPQDSQMRQAQNMGATHMGPTTQSMSMMSMPKFDRPSFSDPKKMQGGSLTHMNSNSGLYVKQEPLDQSNEQHKAQLSSPQGISSLSSAPFKQGNAAPGNSKEDFFEMQSSKTGFPPPTSLSNLRSITSPIGPGNNSKAPPKKPLVGQKKPMEAPGSSPPSSKKQKVSGSYLDQSIEQLNDVTAVSGVNLREEEEQLFSGPKEDSRVSEASRRVVQEEEERLILHKKPLQKKVVEIMAKCGLKSMSNDVERCLSLCVEERMRGLIANLIRLSKQRVDIEKPRHRTIVTSDVRQQIMTINRKAREEWEKKQAETEKSQKQNEPESSNGVDGDKEKDENRAKSAKANKEEDDKMRATAANVAVRAATGVGDMMSRWQLMIEAKQKQGGSDTSPASQPAKDVTTRKPSHASSKNTRENHESEKQDSSTGFSTPASVRKVGRNQVVVPRVARSISVKDVIAILEREPQMSKSTLIYRLYGKVRADAAGE